MLHERSASEYRKPVLYAIIDALQRRRQKEKHAWAIVFLIQHADMLQDHNNRVLMRATDQC
jgi:hypothetical protein